MTVSEVSRRTGVSVRALQYYDKIGLLSPATRTPSGYRLYDDEALERLQQILLFRELQFPLKEIKIILESPTFDRGRVLEQQIVLLTLKKERLERLISFAREIKETGERQMDFSAFDREKLEAYAKEARAAWGGTAAFREFEEKAHGRGRREEEMLITEFMELFAEFGQLRDKLPEAPEVKDQVKKLQAYITEHFYTCTPEILAGLGQMYAADSRMKENIDRAGGEGTAVFAAEAIRLYCRSDG